MDSRYLLEEKKFEGPHPFELGRKADLPHLSNYPTVPGLYAFIRKGGTKVYINEEDEEGSDIVKIGYTKIPLTKRLIKYWNLGQKREAPPNKHSGTAWKIRHFRYFHGELELLFKYNGPKADEKSLNEQFRREHKRKPLLETQDIDGFNKYKNWRENEHIDKESLNAPIGGKEWNKGVYENKYNPSKL